MDPISAAAGAIGALAQAIDLGFTIYSLIDGVKGAPDHIRRLSVEMHGLYSVLTLLSSSLESQKAKAQGFPVHMVNNIKELIDSCIGLFYEIKKVLKPFLDADGRANVVLSLKKGLKWEVVKKEHVENLRISLANNKATLELAISTFNLFNSSQTIDMVAHLQKDVRRLRRQMQQKDRMITGHPQVSGISAYSQSLAADDAYNDPMRRFLARTASVASRASTSSTLIELDSIFSEDVSKLGQLTEYAGEDAPESYLGLNAEYYSDGTEKAVVESYSDNVVSNIPHEVQEKPSIFDISKSVPMPKTLSWKKLFWKNDTKSRSLDTGAHPNANFNTLASSEQPEAEGILPPTDRMFAEPQNFTHTPPAVTVDTSSYFEEPSQGDGPHLTKSLTSPDVQQFNTQEIALPPIPPRSISTPAIRRAVSYGNLDAHSPVRLSGNPYTLADPPPATDREFLLPSLRKPPTPTPAKTPPTTTDPSTPCGACKLPIQTARHYRLASSAWHAACFRCSSCNIPLSSSPSPPFLLADNFLVCSSCSWKCQKCDAPIEEHAAGDAHSDAFARLQTLTPRQLGCSGLFFCHECNRSIKNLRYVRTKQGVFCLGCQNPMMSEGERRRRDGEREGGRERPVLVEGGGSA